MWRFKFAFGWDILRFTSDHSHGPILLLPTKKKSHRAFFWHIRIWLWSILKTKIKVTQISAVTISQTETDRTKIIAIKGDAFDCLINTRLSPIRKLKVKDMYVHGHLYSEYLWNSRTLYFAVCQRWQNAACSCSWLAIANLHEMYCHRALAKSWKPLPSFSKVSDFGISLLCCNSKSIWPRIVNYDVLLQLPNYTNLLYKFHSDYQCTSPSFCGQTFRILFAL